MIFLRVIQLINVCVMCGAMCVKIFGKEETQEKAWIMWIISLIICWIFIILL